MENFGEINVSDEVISIIAYRAALGVKGISGMHNSIGNGIAELLGKKNIPKGVKVNVNNKEVILDLSVIVDYAAGISIPDVAWQVQEKVKYEVEKYTGLEVLTVNVHVEGVNIENTYEDEDDPLQEDFGCCGGCGSCTEPCGDDGEKPS